MDVVSIFTYPTFQPLSGKGEIPVMPLLEDLPDLMAAVTSLATSWAIPVIVGILIMAGGRFISRLTRS